MNFKSDTFPLERKKAPSDKVKVNFKSDYFPLERGAPTPKKRKR